MKEQDVIRAIFSDTTEEYVCFADDNTCEMANIKIRVLHKSVKAVQLICNDNKIEMTISKRNDKGFDFYECKCQTADVQQGYYFCIQGENFEYIYDQRGVVDKVEPSFLFRINPNFSIPDWAKGAVFYQIFVDRFYNGDSKNDVLTGEYKYIESLSVHKEWKEKIENGINEFYGGDLQGVIDKLDYLKDLGVDVLYLNPIFVSPSNHKYDTADYDYIDPHFGVIKNDVGELLFTAEQNNNEAKRFISRITDKENLEASNELFAKLVTLAHEKGIKVILDGVFNHCGSFNKWMDKEHIYEQSEGYEKGAYIDKESPYNGYFTFSENGEWPNNNNYESWWGFDTLPKLNYDNEDLYKYILEIGAKWVSAPYNADGWRLDVAADLGKTPEINHRFWADFRKSVKNANPNAIILAEHYGDPSEWLKGDQWDTVMNYDAFMEPVSWFFTGMEKHNDELKEELKNDPNIFWKKMKECGSKFTLGSLQTAMNELSNHDHSRFITRTTGKVGRVDILGEDAAKDGSSRAIFMEAVVMQMTWPGAPTIYYGDEAGLAGFTDPDNRRVYPWGEEDKELIEFHKELIGLHKCNEELKTGSLIPLPTPKGTIAYGRKKHNKLSIIVINNLNVNMEYKLPVWMLGIGRNKKYITAFIENEKEFSKNGRIYMDKNGILKLVLKPNSSVILQNKNRKKTKNE